MSHGYVAGRQERFFIIIDKTRHVESGGIGPVVWSGPNDSRIASVAICCRRVRVERCHGVNRRSMLKTGKKRFVERRIADVNT